MLLYSHEIKGSHVQVRVVENQKDFELFTSWFESPWGRLGFGLDTETTGLDIYSDENRLRTVQVGGEHTGWVIPVERDLSLGTQLATLLQYSDTALVLHNASFDLQVLERHLGIPAEELWPRVTDTRILAHLVDPRGQEEGGTGQSLEQLTRHHVDAGVADEVKGLMSRLAKEFKTTKAQIWSLPELIDNPDFLLYAGMDPVLALRLRNVLLPLVPEQSKHLVPYEHDIARVCAGMESTGFLLDMVYTEDLSARLAEEEEEASWHAEAFFEVDSVNSTEQVADALEELGVYIPERTPTGKRKVDGALLESLIPRDTDEDKTLRGDWCGIGTAGHLAASVLEAKRARKWRTTWVDGFLDGADSSDRVHPSINPLRARTARMSITGIPAQTLPSGDWMVRRCFVAEPGFSIVSIDYKAQELRVLAALSGDETMIEAFRTGADLHQLTADASGVSRDVGKTVNFAYVYGSGPKNIAEKCGITVATAQKVIKGFEARYPKVKALSTRLQKEARANGYVVTPTGRKLPVDPDRAYSALNYMIQSTSRDITCRGLLRLDEAGFTPFLRLPVHDEVVASVPTAKAQGIANEIARLMRMDFRGVCIDTDVKVYGSSWGAGYMSDEEKARHGQLIAA